jgi:hypothetical protein
MGSDYDKKVFKTTLAGSRGSMKRAENRGDRREEVGGDGRHQEGTGDWCQERQDVAAICLCEA